MGSSIWCPIRRLCCRPSLQEPPRWSPGPQMEAKLNTLAQAGVRRNRLKNNTTRLSPAPDQAICDCRHKRTLAGYPPVNRHCRHETFNAPLDIAKVPCYLICNVQRRKDGRRKIRSLARHPRSDDPEDSVRSRPATRFRDCAAHRKKAWIDCDWGTSENNRKAKFYSITKRGLKQLAAETSNWEAISGVIGRILRLEGPNCHDLFDSSLNISGLRSLRSSKANREFGEEIGTHLELLTERLIRQGMSREDAVCVARRQFGNVGLVQERQREAQAFPWITTVFQDVRYGLRMLAKNRGVTAIAITSLALGIGANTLIFTVAKAALFDALSVPRPEQLRLLAFAQGDRSVLQHDTWGDFYSDAHGRTVLASFSYPIYQALRHQDHSLGDLFAFVDLSQFEHLSATIDGRAEVVTAELVSGNFFQRIGVGTVLGRPIAPADDAIPGSGAVAVISDSFWRGDLTGHPRSLAKPLTSILRR